jgi:isohexenylglutaconyl-CoA hydratase
MGGGFGLAAACDRVIAGDDAVFSMPEVSIGVAPAQIAPFVIRRLGATRARWLMLAAAKLSAREALDAGLADVVVPVAEINAAATATLNALAAAEPGALRATKALVNRTLRASLTDALDAAALDFARLLRGGKAIEGIAATREKRAPAWRTPLPDLPEFT